MREAVNKRWQKQRPDSATAYEQTKPKERGSLHQRMRWAEGLAQRICTDDWPAHIAAVPLLEELRESIFDLIVEVKHYDSDKTPRCKRMKPQSKVK